MTKSLTIALLILTNINCLAQYSLSGHIIDKKNGKAVENAYIFFTELKKHSISDDLGNFAIELTDGNKVELKITCIGYKDTLITISVSAVNQPFTIYLEPNEQKIAEVIITADRRPKKIEDIPARLDLVSTEEVRSYPATNIDNYLQAIPNVYVNRSSGIFSKNSSVTMRGMDGTSRVLVLLDGVPLNFSAGGGINWHMIESGQLEKIEVLKGPASALYGNNAMGGVINLITKKEETHLGGSISLFGGTYNTLGGSVDFGNNYTNNNKGFYWSGHAFYRQGDGYVIVPEEDRDSTDVPVGIKEYSFNLKSGYRFNKNHSVELDLRYYDDVRDQGIKIYENDGSFLKYTTNHVRASYTGNINGWQIYSNLFFSLQDYYEHSERLNETGDSYKLYDRNQRSTDYGLWLNIVKKLSTNNELSIGADYKHGNFWAEDIYFTSTDYFERAGDIDFIALFAQNDLKLLNNKFILSLGVRADFAQFKNGCLNVEDPTSVTAFESQLSEIFENTSWQNISPKIALRFNKSSILQLYTSFSIGFMPPKIDDMVSSRKVSNGFKIANPNLKPETLTNYELGFDLKPFQKLTFSLSAYYSLGNDFQYFVGTGDTVDMDRPVLKRENISKAEIYGLETSINYKPTKYLSIKANYTYNHSQIKDFDLMNYAGDNLSGKWIAETPPHQASLALFFTHKILDINLVTNYISKMWQDELNTILLNSYTTFDLRLQKSIKHLNLSLDIQNLFNYQFIDKKGGIAPGRYVLLNLQLNL